MAVRFIIGRAGSGKTHHCLQAIRRRLRQDPINGPRLILLVPEQSSLQMERALITPADLAGSHRAEVLSFQRLALRVLESAGGVTQRALSEPARAMVLRHLLARLGDKLRYYRRIERLGGFVDQLSATVAELIQGAVDPDDLATAAAQSETDDSLQRAKLHDLREIYAAYLAYLGTERLDPSQFLQVTRDCLPRCSWLGGAELWVDGFASLARQETLSLVALARLCGNVKITVLSDPSLGNPSKPTRSGRGLAGLFSKTRRTYLEIHRAVVEAGVEVAEPLLLRTRRPPRFHDNATLTALEQRWPTAPTSEEAPDGRPVTGLELVELPSRRLEVDYAVFRICRWVQGSGTGHRYRDVAIIVRDLEPYHDLLASALSARGIPFFIDRRRPTAHHPLVELLRSAVLMAATGLSLSAAVGALKTGLLPITVESADELENYLLAHGISGLDAWQGEDWTQPFRQVLDGQEKAPGDHESAALVRINETRKQFVRRVSEWLSFASAEASPAGSQWTEAILALLEKLAVARRLADWSEAAEQDGDLDQAEEHRQVWRDTMSFLDDLAFAFAEEALSIDQLAAVLEAGLARFTLGLAPPMLDQVLVGSIERSRHPELKAAVVVGFNDGVFPKVAGEDSILNDDDRILLTEAGLHVGQPATQRTLEESLFVYIAITRASDELVVTYATADNDGKALRGSPYLDALCRTCPGLTITRISNPTFTRKTWDILASADLTDRLTTELRTRPALEDDDPSVRAVWNGLYEAVRGHALRDASLRHALTALDERNAAALSPASVELLMDGPLRTSVSRLETYAACPFQHFARYGLKLRERAEADLEPVDVGQVHHAILEDFVQTLRQRRQDFSQLSDVEVLAGLNESCAKVAGRLPAGSQLSRARDAYVLRRSASNLARVLQAQRKIAAAGSARPRAAEVPFGFGGRNSLPALELSTPAGRQVLLRGYIDRVDLAELADEVLGVVIDYKRTPDKQLSFAEVYHGLSLQLVAYLLVLAEQGESLTGRPVQPIGAFYVSIVPKYEQADHPDAVSDRDKALPGAYRPRGVLAAEKFEALDATLTSAGWSRFYSFSRKASGEVGHINQSDAADNRSFKAILDHTRAKLGELADGVLDGDVSVKPYRLGTFSPCSWCPMSSICRYEMGLSETRFLEKLKRSEVFTRLADA